MKKRSPKDKRSIAVKRESDLWVYVLIFCATLAAYWPALQGTLLWDDPAHITPPELQSWQGLWRIWTDRPATQQYYPLLHSAFWLEHQLWGDSVVGYHLVNVLLHALSACLVVIIVRNLRVSGAWLAGLIFALHPVCVEAVAWISEQKSTLSGVFYLLSALAYLQFDQSRHKPRYFLALGLFILALLSKTVTATLPAALLLILWWRKGRLEWKRDIFPLVPWIGVGAAAGLFTAWVERTDIGAHGASFNLSIVQRFLIAGRALWFYFAKWIWPYKLTFVYPHWEVNASSPWPYVFPAGAFAVLVFFAIVARRGERGPLTALLYFSGTLFPVLGFLNVYPFVYSYVADHFQYLASLALVVPAGSLLAHLTDRMHGAPRAIVPACIIVILAVLTWRQSGMYRDPETLYRETIARNPVCWMAYNNLGNLLAQSPERSGEARQDYEAALRIKPDYGEAHYNLANLLFQDDLANAIAHYHAAIRFKPDFAEAYANLGTALARDPSRLADAVTEYKAAIGLKPEVAVTHFFLANALSQMPGHVPEAITEYQRAIELDPSNVEAHYNLATVLAKIPGRSQEAIAHLEFVLRLRPDLNSAKQLLERLQASASAVH